MTAFLESPATAVALGIAVGELPVFLLFGCIAFGIYIGRGGRP